ncbi:MAG: hypothetical protein ACKOHI_09375, partial [Phycisphaerales bacterium]
MDPAGRAEGSPMTRAQVVDAYFMEHRAQQRDRQPAPEMLAELLEPGDERIGLGKQRMRRR